MNNLFYMLAAIKTSLNRKNHSVEIYSSKICLDCLNILMDLGFIFGFTKLPKNRVRIFLKYKNNKSVVKNIFSIFKPSNKVYFKVRFIKKSLNKNLFSHMIFLTPKGVLTDLECILFNTGGIPLFRVS